MHSDKHALLQSIGSTAAAALIATAALYGVTANDVVRAGIGRADAGPATKAAADLGSRFPDVFGKLKDWPEDCPFCGRPGALVECLGPSCTAKGCEACVRGERHCPACRERARVAASIAAHRETAERGRLEADAANAKRLTAALLAAEEEENA